LTETIQHVVSFRGAVSCRREPGVRRLLLVGWTADHPEEAVTLEFPGAAPAGLPEALEEVSVDRLAADRFRIAAAGREWIITAPGCHLHREVAAAFYRAIPPRPVPWSKKLFWRLILAAAGTTLGKWLLVRLRGG